MKVGKVVIGSQFGDEGKGLMTDYFVRQMHDPVVIRFNGGAQAGHTVVTSDGKRHVFGHFGAGTFAGAPSHFSQYCIVNPVLCIKELKMLQAMGVSPRMTISPWAMVTTPFDVILNRALEEKRMDDGGIGRHGSCGVGIYETIRRNEREGYGFHYTMRFDSTARFMRLMSRIERYFSTRLLELGLTLKGELLAAATDPRTLLNFQEKVSEMQALFEQAEDADIVRGNDEIVFEGAQGLQLDALNYAMYPHVTPSRTGSTNVAKMLSTSAAKDYELEVVYVTRSYMTRHGNGPFPSHDDLLPHMVPDFHDQTNQPNRWQGHLRLAPVDIDMLGEVIRRDIMGNIFKGQTKRSIAVTCMDHIVKDYPVHMKLRCSKTLLLLSPKMIEDMALQNFNKYYRSTGPTAADVTLVGEHKPLGSVLVNS